ncbi:MAG: DUF4388 domain-containing protein [Acidobacteriota bacterium]
MDLSGRLASMPMAELLHRVQEESRSGVLVVRRSRCEKRVYMSEGRVVACSSDDPAEFYGQYLLLHGHLDQRTLMHCLTICKREGRRLAPVLEDEGVLPRDTIQSTLRQQITDLVCGLFLWKHGIYMFLTEVPPIEESLHAPLDISSIILEGSRWVEEHNRFRHVLIHDGLVPRRGRNWPGRRLPPAQQQVASAVDGEISLQVLHAFVKGPHFRFLEATYRLWEMGVLEVDPDSGELQDSTTMEISLFEIFLDQVAEEQILHARHHLPVPLEIMERSVPVWVIEPEDADLVQHKPWARRFLLRLDGTRRLGELLATSGDQRSRELGLLIRQLRDGAVALLPSPLQDHEAIADPRRVPQSQRWWRRVFRGPVEI